MHEFISYPTAQAQAESLAQCVTKQLEAALDQSGRASLAVPGGSTPKAFLEALSEASLTWSAVTALLTDERLVPEDSSRSNTRLVKRTLLQNQAAQASFVSFLNKNAAQDLGPHLPLDVCVLGMGEDMHTASLFPAAPELARAVSYDCLEPLVSMTPQDGLEPRISLSGRAITNSNALHLLIRGAGKMLALERAMQASSPLEAPVQLILGRPNLTIHYTD